MPNTCAINFNNPAEDILLVQLIGNWQIEQKRPGADEVLHQVETSTGVKRIVFDTEKLTGWDSSLLTFLTRIFKRCGQRNVQVETEGLPQGVQSLISLSTAVPKKEDARKTVSREAFFARVGSEFLEFIQSAGELIAFIGEAFVASARLFAGKARFRAFDLGQFLQDTGAQCEGHDDLRQRHSTDANQHQAVQERPRTCRQPDGE